MYTTMRCTSNLSAHSARCLASPCRMYIRSSRSWRLERLNFAIITHSAVDDSLKSVLKDELKYEREYYRKDEVLLTEPPNGFEIDNPAGKSAFYLLKEHKSETIVIEVDLDNQPDASDPEGDDEGGPSLPEEGEEEEEDVLPVKFRVTISKPSTLSAALIFECESDGEYLSINHIAHEPSPKEDEGDEDEEDDGTPDYTGPVFEELDDTLQQAFLDYLEERGVTAELGGFLRLLCVDKMAVEYQAWLGRVKDFISKP